MQRAGWLMRAALLLSILTAQPDGVFGAPQYYDSDGTDSAVTREFAAQRILWRAEGGAIEQHDRVGLVDILAINDFHGHLSEGRRIGDRPIGGAAVLASYLTQARYSPTDTMALEHTLIVHAGDHVGASTPESSFFQDEPSISFLNM